MRRLIIIDTYPIGKREQLILNMCIDALVGKGYDLMITTHCPVDKSIADKVNYVVYDSNNTFLPEHLTPYYWLETQEFKLKIYNAGHTLPICRNVSNGIHLASSLKYDDFVFMEADVILSNQDLELLSSYLDEMNATDKKMVYFKPVEYRDCNGSRVYETLLFAGKPDYFLSKFKPPLTVEDWISLPMGYTLELSFFEQFSKYEDEFLIIEDHSSVIFNTSKVNLFRYGLFNCEMVYNEDHPDYPILFLANSLIEIEPKYIFIYKDEILVNQKVMYKGQFWHNAYQFDGSSIRVLITDDEEKQLVFMDKTFIMKEENNQNFIKKGTFKNK
ncbi:MAG: hypothetical protein RLZZ614_641 [Bacteroidota bacterium]|jgi:hypothetical protein